MLPSFSSIVVLPKVVSDIIHTKRQLFASLDLQTANRSETAADWRVHFIIGVFQLRDTVVGHLTLLAGACLLSIILAIYSDQLCGRVEQSDDLHGFWRIAILGGGRRVA